MELLEGAAAFTVVMIVFSTVVSGLVEIVLRVTATRPAVVMNAVRAFAETRLKAAVNNAVKSLGDRIDASVIAELVANPVAGVAAQAVAEKAACANPKSKASANWPEKFWAWLIRPFVWFRDRRRLSEAVVDTLTTYSFMQRLAKSAIGKQLAAVADDELERVLADISRTYERYVAASNELFRKNANLLGVVVSVALAFALNIDAGRVFTFLMETPDARSALIDSAEEAASGNQEALKDLNELIAQLNSGDQNRGLEGDEGAGYAAIEAARKDIAQLKEDLAPLLQTPGLPIGSAFFPYCVDPNSEVPKDADGNGADQRKSGKGAAAGAQDATPNQVLSTACLDLITRSRDAAETAATARRKALREEKAPAAEIEAVKPRDSLNYLLALLGAWDFWKWMLNVLVAGILISLGGPFWYKVFTSLSGLLQLARQFTGRGGAETIKPAAKDQPASADAQDPEKKNPKALSEAFRIAAGVAPPPTP